MKFSCASLLLAALVVPASGQTGYVNGQAARGEVGQPNFLGGYENSATATVEGTGINIISTAQGVAATPNLLFIADSSILVPQGSGNNNRVLIFNSGAFPGPHADLTGLQPNRCPLCFFNAINVLGQPDFNTATQVAAAANTMNVPTAVATDGTILVVADTNNNRVLIWNQIPTSIQQPADLVLGQTNFTTVAPDSSVTASTLSGPQGVWVYNGKLFVADTQNSRVLIWNTIPTTNNQPADVVLGEPNFTTRYVAPATGAIAAANTLYDPVSVTTDGTHLFVADLGNHRVLIWNGIPTTNQQPADVEVGQLDMTHNASNDGPNLCAATGQNALGDYVYQAQCGRSMSYPRFALSDGTRLYVADGGNDRVLIYKSIPTVSGISADNVLGQPDLISNVTSDASQLITSTVVSNNSSADTLRTPSSLAWDGTNLWVADPYDARVLYFTPGDSNLILPNSSVLNAASLEIHAEGYVVIALAATGDTITAGNTVTVTIGGTGYTYTIVAGDTLNSIVNALVKLINNSNSGAGDPNAIARNAGSNTLALQAIAQGSAGNSVSLAASTSSGATVSANASGIELTGGNGATLAPGTLVVINAPTGVNFSPDGQNHTNTDTPLDLTFEGIQVYVDGVPCPIAYVNPDQIRVQIPYRLYIQSIAQTTNSASLYVRKINPDGSISASNAIPLIIVDANPGIFNLNDATPPTVMAFHANDHATAVVSVDGTITAGNTATVTVGSNSYTYTVQASDTLATVQAALVALLNNDPNVTATASGQFTRITLTARAAGPAGLNIPVTSSVSSGAAIIITVFNATTCCINTAGAPVTLSNPAAANELINIFATGLGVMADTSGNVIDVVEGQPYSGPQPNSALASVSATMDGTTAQVLSAGFQPGAIGLSQVTIQVPSTLTTNAVSQLYIAQNAYISNIVNIPVGGGPVLFTVEPVVVSPGVTVGSTTIYAQVGNPANIRVGSATGTLLCTITGFGSCQTGNWVTNGMPFYLVDQGTGAVLIEAFAQLTSPLATLTANPNPIISDGTGLGVTTITVNSNVPVNIYVGGTIFCGPITTGTCTTGKWVTNGMVFSAIEQGTNTVVGTVTVAERNPTAFVTISPVGNDGSGLGIATVSFVADLPGEIYVGSTLFCTFNFATSGTCTTGKWVTPSTVFKVVDPNTGVVLGTGSPTFVPAAGTITLFPNPIVDLDGTGVVYANITTTSNVDASVYVGSTLLCNVPVGQGSCSTGKYVKNGTVLNLVNAYNGQTLSSATVQVVQPYGTLSIPGNPFVPDSNGLATATLNYTTVGNAAIYVNSTLLCNAPAPSGSCQTGEWVRNGMVFTLIDTTTNAVLGTATAYVFNDATISLSPNPIQGGPNGLGSTVVNFWSNVPADIYVGSKLFCSSEGGTGSCATGPWVSNGAVFTIVDHQNGATLASTTAQVTTTGQ